MSRAGRVGGVRPTSTVRVDVFATAGGSVPDEVNTMPGMTPLSQVRRMSAAAGVPSADLAA